MFVSTNNHKNQKGENMKIDQKNYKFDVASITTDNNIIAQKTLTIAEHDVPLKYQMLAKNIFTADNTVFCPGYFNKKTDFIIGEVNSLIVVDNELNQITKNTSELIKDDVYIIYPVPCLNMEFHNILEYKNNVGEIDEIILDGALGEWIGKFLSGSLTYDELLTIFPEYSGFFKLFINLKNGLSLNKNILLNSNPVFIINILKGYYGSNGSSRLYINSNVNIYTFTTILNYLGASYSIRNGKHNTKKMFIQLPMVFNKYLPNKFIKKQEYGFNEISGNVELFNINQLHESKTSSLSDKINSGQILLIPISAIDFNIKDESRIYDLMAENHDATNYSIPMTPVLKNSDGDILAASGIFTKEGLIDAEKFSPDNKEYYRNLNDGNISQWIADDAILGLYNATLQ